MRTANEERGNRQRSDTNSDHELAALASSVWMMMSRESVCLQPLTARETQRLKRTGEDTRLAEEPEEGAARAEVGAAVLEEEQAA